ncbi:MAG: hypothetical protein WBN20_02330 [Eudoraea sp.]|uniref:hypothetical protein n=1 Tax=Eudoraea sp. TaxID=1979955 RepID=UPI003C78575C
MKSIIKQGPVIAEAYDTNTEMAHAYFNKVKEWVASQAETIDELDIKARSYDNEALAFRTMLKFIESENIILNLNEQVTLTLINPVYKETGRMQKREQHPHGENSLRTKIACIQHFERINPLFKGRVFVVDDGCPDASGVMAENIVSEYPGSPHKVFFLAKAIDENDIDLPAGITHKNGSNRSVKGGAALLGMQKALKTPAEGIHVIVDNDADLSVHPMQLGLLVQDIVDGKTKTVAGSRREEDSVSLIGGSRNLRGNLFIQIWQHFLPQLAQRITDTNRAFKAFESSALERILPSIKIYTFPYQIELLQACISMDIPLIKKGVAYIDSEAASTQSGANITETYLNQINQIIDIAKRYNTIPISDPLMKFLSSISEDEWRVIEANPPTSILDLLE